MNWKNTEYLHLKRGHTYHDQKGQLTSDVPTVRFTLSFIEEERNQLTDV